MDGLLRLDIGRPDHLGPLLSLLGHVLTIVSGGTCKHSDARVGKSCPDVGIGKTRAYLSAVMQSGRTATNLGCIGNRVYTELPDDELYFAIAGPQLEAVVNKLVTIAHANHELEKFHRGRVA